ncbi:MAG: penicillin-binding protein 2 [Candidatus Omnitrophota bacterium]|nr:penicillin-binding protein 2 [Candidatus Omnitrophota bacterium]
MFRIRRFLVFFFLIAFLTALLVRLFYLQVLRFHNFSEMASEQHNQVRRIEPRRGTIFDRNMEPLAINLDTPSVYCDPREVRDKERAAELLSRVLNMDSRVLSERLKRDKAFIWVKRKVSVSEEEEVRKLGIKGVYLVNESKRNYSSESMASHVIGFAGIDNEGLEGIELMFDADLRGQPGWRRLLRDARMRTVLYNERESIPPQNGCNLVLTIDSVIQYIVEDELERMVKKYHASGASAIVMDPSTGKILAMANYPDHDLNSYRDTPRELIKNAAISSVYEPGSVFKIVTASAALDEKAVELDDTIHCGNGEYRSGGRILHDYHGYGKLSFLEVIAKSSNIGTVKVAQELGSEKVYEYIRKFGFGEKTGIDLPGEISGLSRPPGIWSRSDITTIPIGQGIAVTPIQLACAVSVISNGGYLMRPYIVDRITSWDGRVLRTFEPLARRRVLSGETCGKMKDIMRNVVTIGTGRRARSRFYDTCGKTGTAQMVNPEGGYYPDKYHATFIGFAPMEEPAISVVVTAHDPHPVYFGGSVAGPTFRKIVERSLQYMGSGTAGVAEKTSVAGRENAVPRS